MARDMQKEAMSSVECKADGSPVTHTDKEVERYIVERLGREFPDIPVIGEETIQPTKNNYPQENICFLVDPIDGTGAYIKGRDDYTVNIALIKDGVAVAGVIDAPGMGAAYYGGRTLGAFRVTGDKAADPIHVQALEPDRLRIIVSRFYARETEFASLLSLCEDQISVESLSSSLKFCRIAEGDADFYPRRGRTCYWDSAAGQAILEGAGGAVIRISDHQDLFYNVSAGGAVDNAHAFFNPDFFAISSHNILKYIL